MPWIVRYAKRSDEEDLCNIALTTTFPDRGFEENGQYSRSKFGVTVESVLSLRIEPPLGLARPGPSASEIARW